MDHAEFQDFLKRLQARINEGVSKDGRIHNATDEFALHLESSVTMKSYRFFSDPVKSSQQKRITESLLNFKGAFLTIYELQADSDEVTLLWSFLSN